MKIPRPYRMCLSLMLNIDPDAAANAYRQRVLAQMGPSTPA